MLAWMLDGGWAVGCLNGGETLRRKLGAGRRLVVKHCGAGRAALDADTASGRRRDGWMLAQQLEVGWASGWWMDYCWRIGKRPGSWMLERRLNVGWVVGHWHGGRVLAWWLDDTMTLAC